MLVEAVFLKLRWNGSANIPIKDLEVYFISIPLNEGDIRKLQQIQRVNMHLNTIYKLNLNMSLREFFNEWEEVMKRLAQLIIEEIPTNIVLKLNSEDEEEISFMGIIKGMQKFRD